MPDVYRIINATFAAQVQARRAAGGKLADLDVLLRARDAVIAAIVAATGYPPEPGEREHVIVSSGRYDG